MGEILAFEAKSGIKAGDGGETGRYKFFTSSDVQSKFIDKAVFEGEHLILSSGGQAGIHYCNEPFSASTDCFVATVNNRLETKYVYYFLLMNIRVLEAGFRGSGLHHISKKYVEQIRVPYPEDQLLQKEIVARLDKLQTSKVLRDTANDLAQRLLKSVFLEMFGDPLRNPMKWPMKRISEFGKVMTGNTPPRRNAGYYGDYIDWMKSDNLNTPFTFTTRSEEKLSKRGAAVGRIAPRGAVLVTCIAGSLSSIGNAAIADRDVAFNQQINAVIPNRDINSYFLYHLLVLSKKRIQDSSTHSMKGMVSKSTFEGIELVSPPLELQKRFGTLARNYEDVLANQVSVKAHISNLFNAILAGSFGR